MNLPLPERPAVAKAQWVVSISLDVEGLPLQTFDALHYTDAWAAKNPNYLGTAIATFIHERGARRAAQDKQNKARRKR